LRKNAVTEEENTKKCTKCKEVKAKSEFSKNMAAKDGLQGTCKACYRIYRDEHKAERAIKAKLYRDEHKDEQAIKDKVYRDSHKEAMKAYREDHKDEIAAQTKAYRESHKEVLAAQKKVYQEEHKEAMAEYRKVYYEERREDISAQRRAYREDNKEEVRAFARAYKASHKEELKAYRESRKDVTKAYRESRKEEASAWHRVYYATYRERISAQSRIWRNANPEKCVATLARYRASKLKATPKWSEKTDIESIYAESTMRSKTEGVKYQVDHIVPLQSELVCGLHCFANLQILTRAENIRKGNRHWPGKEWILS
jgi:hypothetical protein